MPIHEISQLHVFIRFHFYRLPFRAVLQIPVSLAPPVFIDDIGERDTAYRAKPANGVPYGQQGIGVDVRRQTHRGLGFPLELQVKRRQGRPGIQVAFGLPVRLQQLVRATRYPINTCLR